VVDDRVVVDVSLDLGAKWVLSPRWLFGLGAGVEHSHYRFSNFGKLLPGAEEPLRDAFQVKLSPTFTYLFDDRWAFVAGVNFGAAGDPDAVVSGSMTAQQALAQMFQSIADSFMDMVAQMIASWAKIAVAKGISSIIGMIIPGFGAATSPGGLEGVNMGAVNQYSAPLGYANGGVASGGFRAFASGGVVSGPTLGLVGEGRYNEAVIPLPDGKSVPVDLGGAGGGGQITSNIVVNVNSDGQSQSQQSGNGSAELGKKIEGAVKQVIVGELRPGGLLAGRR
jgi:hypothetical protein